MIHNYSTEEATVECANDCPEVTVTANPPAGSQLNFPSYVILVASDPRAVIHYTTDGTDPDELSTEYTGPILVTSSGMVIRAVAVIAGCTPGLIAVIQFINSAFTFAFSYACDTPDKGGSWGVFTPDGTNDHHWVAQLQLTGATTIKRLELYQLDASGNWTTGQAWSTDSPIHPWPDRPDDTFAVFPLLVFDTAVQQWAAYQSSLGSFGPATITWDLYGDRVIAASGLFRLDIILGDDSKLSQIIDGVTCTVTPPLCPPPAAPTVTGKCDGKVDVTFAGSVGRPYEIYKSSSSCGTGEWTLAASGTIDASPKTVEVSGLTEGCLYSFYVSVDEVSCGFRDSNPASATPLPEPTVSISTNKTIVNPNESFTISWNSNNIGGATCGGCLAGEVSINQSIGCKAGNVAGSQAQSQAVCGIYTYQITGCNTCGTVVASVQVEVRCLAACSGTQPTRVGLASQGTFLCEQLGGCPVLFFNDPLFWDGIMPIVAPGSCRYIKASDSQEVLGCVTVVGTIWNGLRGDVEIGFDNSNPLAPFWWIRVTAQTSGPAEVVWYGTKLLGNTPIGTYNKTGGCASGPATVNVIQV